MRTTPTYSGLSKSRYPTTARSGTFAESRKPQAETIAPHNKQARAGKSENMRTYTVKVTCEYYVEVDAESEAEAVKIAHAADYDVCDLQNFEYKID